MEYKYIIMCGGEYPKWEQPRQLTEINGESLVSRTLRLLWANGVHDISISSNDERFATFGVPLLKHPNSYRGYGYNNCTGYWVDAFYPLTVPACYIFGDVYFSPESIRTIIDTETDDVMLFGSKPPFSPQYPKWYIEPFAFKVANQTHFRESIERVKELDAAGQFYRKPIAWELWSVICGTNINKINGSYTNLCDYTSDIDNPGEINQLLCKIPKE